MKTAREYLEAILVAVLLALFAKAFLFEAFEIPSSSMETTLLPGDHVLVNKFLYGKHEGPWRRILPHRDLSLGDVAVFRSPETPEVDLIKRVTGLSGDLIELQDKALRRNGRPVPEPWAIHRDERVYTRESGAPDAVRRRDDFGPFEVPRASFFAMGDNRDESRDSRAWGVVDLGLLRGRAVLVYWSYDTGAAPRFTGRAAGLRRLLDTALNFPKRTRWGRSFLLVTARETNPGRNSEPGVSRSPETPRGKQRRGA
ncbi:MAG: signal peptidase I [Acidobacteria bacterium]|nr:signal peptidase I [Acidobacteriota bacterium]